MPPNVAAVRDRRTCFLKEVSARKQWAISACAFHSSCLAKLSFQPKEHFMSQHRSLRSSSTIAAKRNVLKRFERVDLLKKRGQWKEGRSVMNLPKTKPDV
jgi:small basic protein (TIGR04137 family)